MTSFNTGSAVQDSDFVFALVSVSAGMPLFGYVACSLYLSNDVGLMIMWRLTSFLLYCRFWEHGH